MTTTPTHHSSRHTRRLSPAVSGRRRGVIIIIALLALMLMASLLFYVFNTGRNVQTRLLTQNAADAAVMAGATHLARSLNATAMNNVEMARMIATVNVLDATEEALHPAYHEADTHLEALQALYPSAGGNLSAREAGLIREQIDPIIEDYQNDFDQLEPIKQVFTAPPAHPEYSTPAGSVDVRTYTVYSGPSGRGMLWRAMEALDLYSQTILENLPELSQITAAQGGRVNLVERGATGQAMLTPVLPAIPWERGEFDDFQRPVEDGLLMVGVDDRTARRGPYDAIFGWRLPVTDRVRTSEGNWESDGPPSTGNGPGGPGGIGPPNIDGGHWDPPPTYETNATAYRVYGPQWRLLHRYRGRSDFRLRRSPMERNRSLFAQRKLEMLWHDRSSADFRFPVFLNNWSEMTGVADSGSQGGTTRTIYRTRYFVARIESEHPPTSPNYLTADTYQVVDNGRIITLEGDWTLPVDACAPLGGAGFGNDPRYWQQVLERFIAMCPRFANLPAATQNWWVSAEFVNLQNSDWRKTRFSSKMVRDGEEVYQIMYYFCLAIDVGEELEIRNPHNFTDRGDLPAPIDLIHDELEWDDTVAQRDMLTFLGTAQVTNSGTYWAPRFNDVDGYPNHVAIAQARVFNNHSWDMWTQMWHAQLEPVTNYAAWLELIDEGSTDASVIPGMESQDYDDLAVYLTTLEPLADVMLQH